MSGIQGTVFKIFYDFLSRGSLKRSRAHGWTMVESEAKTSWSVTLSGEPGCRPG